MKIVWIAKKQIKKRNFIRSYTIMKYRPLVKLREQQHRFAAGMQRQRVLLWVFIILIKFNLIHFRNSLNLNGLLSTYFSSAWPGLYLFTFLRPLEYPRLFIITLYLIFSLCFYIKLIGSSRREIIVACEPFRVKIMRSGTSFIEASLGFSMA